MKAKSLVAVGLALSLAGCASMSDGSKTKAQGTGIGALIGAGIGAIIGNQFDSPQAGAAIGAMIGGAAGYAYGNHVAGKKSQFAKQEDYLDACLAEATQVKEEAVAYNQALEQDIAGLSQQVDEMVAAMQNRTAERAQKNALASQLKAKRREADQQIAKVSEEIRVTRELIKNESQSGAGQQLAALQEQVDQLETQKNELTQRTQQLAALSSRMSM